MDDHSVGIPDWRDVSEDMQRTAPDQVDGDGENQDEPVLDVPDFVGKLLGVRYYRTGNVPLKSRRRPNRYLYSVNRPDKVEWQPGTPVKARCESKMHKHPGDRRVPNPNCFCGLYAFYKWEPPWFVWRGQSQHADLPWVVCAVVSAWGFIEEHEKGFRSEYMQIEAIVSPSKRKNTFPQRRLSSKSFAKTYGVPLIAGPSDIPKFMDEFPGGVRLDPTKE